MPISCFIVSNCASRSTPPVGLPRPGASAASCSSSAATAAAAASSASLLVTRASLSERISAVFSSSSSCCRSVTSPGVIDFICSRSFSRRSICVRMVSLSLVTLAACLASSCSRAVAAWSTCRCKRSFSRECSPARSLLSSSATSSRRASSASAPASARFIWASSASSSLFRASASSSFSLAPLRTRFGGGGAASGATATLWKKAVTLPHRPAIESRTFCISGGGAAAAAASPLGAAGEDISGDVGADGGADGGATPTAPSRTGAAPRPGTPSSCPCPSAPAPSSRRMGWPDR
mmetsp:Transcript_25252/g.75023  ORF Transcript_25252/g.75023 Transcript_25252/m.75023 type:complete len:293 (+) Transcript_25252:2572-3450(+)